MSGLLQHDGLGHLDGFDDGNARGVYGDRSESSDMLSVESWEAPELRGRGGVSIELSVSIASPKHGASGFGYADVRVERRLSRHENLFEGCASGGVLEHNCVNETHHLTVAFAIIRRAIALNHVEFFDERVKG